MLRVFLTLCSIVGLSPVSAHYVPHGTDPGLCRTMRLQCNDSLVGSDCPQCDARGDFLPQQCWEATGSCWCVDVLSGEEIPHSRTPPGLRPANCSELEHWSCPDGWSRFRETCFTFIDTPKKWIEAEVYCQFDGGNLASIHSEEENHFIMSLTRGYTQNFPETWIGGFDAIHPGYWMWSDGSDLNYENWYSDSYVDDGGHDNDYYFPRGAKNCLKINYEYELKWFHDYCTNYFPFVCAKQAHRSHH